MIEDLEDNYPEYLLDEAGYRWDAWDMVSADAMRRHDVIARSGADQLDALDPAALDDLDRWAYARASRSLGDVEGFLAAARLIVASPEEHIAVDYADVFQETVAVLADVEAFDEVATVLDTARERWPDDLDFVRLSVLIDVRRDRTTAEPVLAAFLATHADDPELLFELCEDLAGLGLKDLATRALDATESAAARDGRSTLVDVKLMREQLHAAPAEDVRE